MVRSRITKSGFRCWLNIRYYVIKGIEIFHVPRTKHYAPPFNLFPVYCLLYTVYFFFSAAAVGRAGAVSRTGLACAAVRGGYAVGISLAVGMCTVCLVDLIGEIIARTDLTCSAVGRWLLRTPSSSRDAVDGGDDGGRAVLRGDAAC